MTDTAGKPSQQQQPSRLCQPPLRSSNRSMLEEPKLTIDRWVQEKRNAAR